MTPDAVPSLRAIQLVAFCSMVSMRLCDTMLGALAQDFGVSVGEAAGVIGYYAVAYGGMQLVYGPLADRVGKLRVILGAATACALIAALTALAPGLGWLLWGRAAMGGAAAGIIPLCMAWIGDRVRYDLRQETLARLLNATVLGLMLGQWFGGLAVQYLGWRSAFLVLAALFALSARHLQGFLHQQAKGDAGTQAAPARPAQALGAGAGGRPPEGQRPEALERPSPTLWRSLTASLQGTLRLLTLPRVRWVLTVSAIEGAMFYGCMAFAPVLLNQRFGVSPAAAGVLMLGVGVGGLLYSRWAGRWVRFWGERGLALLGGSLMVLGLLLWAWSPTPWAAALGSGAVGLGFYMVHNTLQTQATQMAPEARGTAVTLFACVLFMGQSLGVAVLSQVADHGLLSLGFSAAALILAVLCSLISRQLRPAPPR